MRFRLSLIALLCVPAACAAQTVTQAPQAPREQALTQRVINEINANIACTTDSIVLQQQIADLREELRKAKEPPPDANKKP